MSDQADGSSVVYQLPSPGAGISGFRLIRFLGRLLPVWYQLFLLLSALLALVPLIVFEEESRTVFEFLGFSAPLVLAVIMSPLIRVRYAFDVVRRIEVAPPNLLVETFAMDYRWPLGALKRVETENSPEIAITKWEVRYKDETVGLRVWVPVGSSEQANSYGAVKKSIASHLSGRFHDKETAQQR